MPLISDLEHQLNQYCKSYARLTETQIGRRFRFHRFRVQATLEALGDVKKGANKNKIAEEEVFASLQALQSQIEPFGTVVAQAPPPTNTRRIVQLEELKNRLSELGNLVSEALNRLVGSDDEPCVISNDSERARQGPSGTMVSESCNISDDSCEKSMASSQTLLFDTSPVASLSTKSPNQSGRSRTPACREKPDTTPGSCIEVIELSSDDESTAVNALVSEVPTIDFSDSNSDDEQIVLASSQAMGYVGSSNKKRRRTERSRRNDCSVDRMPQKKIAPSLHGTESTDWDHALSSISSPAESEEEPQPQNKTERYLARFSGKKAAESRKEAKPKENGNRGPPRKSKAKNPMEPSKAESPHVGRSEDAEPRAVRQLTTVVPEIGQIVQDEIGGDPAGSYSPDRKVSPGLAHSKYVDLSSIPVLEDRTKTHRGVKNAGHLQESHKKTVYDAAWSNDFAIVSDEQGPQLASRFLATCGSNFVAVYQVAITDEVRGTASSPFVLEDSYRDTGEDFYSCAFAGRSRPLHDTADYSTVMPQLLCAGGRQQCIHVIDVLQRKRLFTLNGHGDEILDLKPSPVDEWILLSCSADESIRLWNLKMGTPVAILTGQYGHREHVTSISWHASGNRIVSAGMDNTVKIWDAGEGTLVNKAIAGSHDAHRRYKETGEIIHFKPTVVDTPVFSTNKMHVHCVDCVEFVGNLVLSKSVDSQIELWCPVFTRNVDSDDTLKPPDNLVALRTFHYSKGDVWYMRFATDPSQSRLAVGNVEGRIFLWDIDSRSSQPVKTMLPGSRIGSPVRGLVFSPCGNILVATMDNGMVYKWDVKKKS